MNILTMLRLKKNTYLTSNYYSQCFYGLIVVVLIASFLPVIYSYIVYQRVVVRGNQRLSPPFDEDA